MRGSLHYALRASVEMTQFWGEGISKGWSGAARWDSNMEILAASE